MKDILVIAPFDLTKSQIRNLEESFNNLPYRVRFSETQTPYSQNLEAIHSNTGAIVSRGGLGELLRNKSSIPYIQIPITPFDLLRSIIHVNNQGFQKIRVMFYAGIFHDTESIISEFGSSHIEVETYHDPNYAKKQIKLLAEQQSVDAIIGDRLATDSARDVGIPSFLVKSGEEALVFAIEQAVETLNHQIEQEAKRQEVESILQVVPQAVVNLNAQNEIKMCNEQARVLFPKLAPSFETLPYSDVFTSQQLQDQLNAQTPKRNILTNVGDQQMLVTTTPIFSDGLYTGAIQIFERLADIQKLELKIRKEVYQKGLTAKHTFEDIICENLGMKKLVNDAAAFARSEGTVLIYGETGTGKELFAQSIHHASHRQIKPFVSINCGSLNENLLESELFGYEEGAFTGAMKGGRAGLFELAHEGTLFLDEINEMSRSFQTKLLRVLQEKEVRRVGGMRYIPVNVRIICATNQPMDRLIQEQQFKEDLYYRISTLTIDLPPLRERKEDILPLAMHFLDTEMKRENRFLRLRNGSETLEPFTSKSWYGNARELQNIIQRLVITYPDHELTSDGIASYLESNSRPDNTVTIPISDSFKEMENSLWTSLYQQFQGSKQEFCDHYQISPTTLWRKLSNLK
ncbi:sigma 54-interacting transcriptional regulator [Alkalicoccobacillus murimartini]|uniref:Transcriptional regulator with PAS, ATPase and Fis domain n=1 Tax=Alkalicoccobacillus murimartini TaxID=171685 RepID=A0ABT9YIB9_9BACI|nr:sigma 54-interacting transcriptional regulator [Alkalicoccobacillus murimartini]MDQ0207606.1 transcriptional regulator with PAS, ATPase and Fis domain [Alkalicoccobacillus murimartini]